MKDEYIMQSRKVDKEFFLMTPPLSVRECQALETRLLEDGNTDPVCVWNNKIVDGYEKYEICTRLQIPFETEQVPALSRQEAIIWICKKQLQRDDLTADVKRFLIGKRYIAENKAAKSKVLKNISRPNVKKAISAAIQTVDKCLGKEYALSPDQLIRYRMYARAVDKLADIVPEIHKKIMDCNIILSVKPTIKYSKPSVSDIKELSTQILDKPYALTHIIRGRPVAVPSAAGRPKKIQNQVAAIDMTAVPKHDGNAEVSSLASTVTAWTKAIKRVINSTDMECVSDKEIAILVKELSELSGTIDAINKIIQERKNAGS